MNGLVERSVFCGILMPRHVQQCSQKIANNTPSRVDVKAMHLSQAYGSLRLWVGAATTET